MLEDEYEAAVFGVSQFGIYEIYKRLSEAWEKDVKGQMKSGLCFVVIPVPNRGLKSEKVQANTEATRYLQPPPHEGKRMKSRLVRDLLK